jgi:4-hydroxybenzoate polyprenyltransferase
MAVYRARMSLPGAAWAKLRIILEMIKFEHTIFALPFAIISVLLAARKAGLPGGVPKGFTFVWILVAMVAARSAAMAFNRLVDARFDAANPRTATRAIPAGLLTRLQVGLFVAASCALFLLAAWQLNPLCLMLSPVALAAVLGYSLTKRFTSLCHLVLGFAIGIAPIGAWIAVTGTLHPLPIILGVAVMLWIGGFDIIYALQDDEFDRSVGLHSLPKVLGRKTALFLSRLMHIHMIILLIAIGFLGALHVFYFVGVGLVAALIAYEQSIVSPNDLSRVNLAFFTLNGWISMSLLLFVLLDRLAAR